MNYQVIIIYLLVAVNAKLLGSKPEKHIGLEVGQAYNQNIPLLFKRFQHSKLSHFKRDVTYYQQPICEIRLAEPALLRQITHLQHNNTAEQQQNSQRIIYKFEQLRSARVFIDAIQQNSIFVGLYQSNEIIFYSMNPSNGVLDVAQTIKIQGISINDGQFAINQNHVLLFTDKTALKIDIGGIYEKIAGYSPIEYFDDIKSNQQYIFIAAGNKGVITYKYDSTSQSLHLISNASFFAQAGNLTTIFDANRIYFESSSRILYVLDRQQGVISTSLDKILKGGPIEAHQMRVLMGGCENIVTTAFSIFLTCPELVQLDRQTGIAMQISHNSFYAYEMQLSGERLFLYGHRQVAVYDMFGDIVEEYVLQSVAEESFVVGDYLVSFSDSQVFSFYIIAQQEQLYCYAKTEEKSGKYEGSFITTGLCSQFFQSPQNNNLICQVQYPFVLKVVNSVFEDYKLEFIVAGSWMLLMAAIGLALAIRHHLVHKSYRELVEEESREQIEIVPKVELQKQREELTVTQQ